MKRTRNFLLALTASAMLALGATAPAFAGPPSNEGTRTACANFDKEGVRVAQPARDALPCNGS